MKLIPIATAFAFLASSANAETIYVEPSPFWNSYYAASNGFAQGYARSSELRANEAMINAYRQSLGLPPCTLRLLAFDMPRC